MAGAWAQNPSGPGNPDDPTVADLVLDPETGHFTKAPPPEHGWQAFADMLQAVSPGVNTAIPLSPSQITDHIAAQLNAGQAQAALELIEKRQAQRDEARSLGTDVQLAYLHGRALAQLGRHDEAIQVWRTMTIDFPELPEPWNALAIEYARRGQLDLAREALNTALVTAPNFAPALENLGHVNTRLAERAFSQARAARGEAVTGSAPGNAAQ
ncbi:MAG TPA: hypothetical protein VL024_04895 [Castellaniella sp.]|nr:hypothetical protein [Castellaniella sp.]